LQKDRLRAQELRAQEKRRAEDAGAGSSTQPKDVVKDAATRLFLLRRAVISRVVLLVLALSRQFWLCSVYFSIRNPFIVANCIEERASRLDGEVLAGVLFGRSGGFPRPQNVLSIEESRGHLDVDDDKRLEALMWKATATPVESNALSASTATRVKSNLPSAATATLVKSNLPSASMSSATATPTKSSALSASVTPTTTSSARRR
jgi:hypothetical protein